MTPEETTHKGTCDQHPTLVRMRSSLGLEAKPCDCHRQGELARPDRVRHALQEVVYAIEAYCDDHASDRPTDVTVLLPMLRAALEDQTRQLDAGWASLAGTEATAAVLRDIMGVPAEADPTVGEVTVALADGSEVEITLDGDNFRVVGMGEGDLVHTLGEVARLCHNHHSAAQETDR